MKTNFFDNVYQWKMDRDGHSVKIPAFYYDNSMLNAIYTASTEKVKKLLPAQDMRLLEMMPGRCFVVFTAFEYRACDLDPYNEFSIAFLINHEERQFPALSVALQYLQKHLKLYVWQLPVTTEIARYGGVELYGYPKFLADIKFTKSSANLECNLAEKGKKILTLTGKKLKTSKEDILRYSTFSEKDGIALMANLHINPLEFSQSLSSDSCSLKLYDEHPIGQRLRTLELSDNPVLYQYAPQFEGILFPARNVRDV